MNKEQIELLEKRKKELERHRLFGFLLIPIICYMIVIGNFLTWILILIFAFLIGKGYKELNEIKFKLAEKR